LPNGAVAQNLGKQVPWGKEEGKRQKAQGERLKEDALRELEESSSWMKLLVDDGVLRSGQVSSLLKEFDELIAIFVTNINRAKDK